MRLPFQARGPAIGLPIWALGTSEPIRLLLIDDDDDEASLTRSLLSKVQDIRYQLDWVASYDEGLAAIARDEHHAYLIDQQLGGRSGIDLVREARAAGSLSALIMMTGRRDRETDILAMDAGATDFLLKGKTDAALLDRTLRYSISQSEMVSALDRSRNQLAGLEEIGRLLVDDGPTPATVERIVELIVDRFSLPQVAIYLTDGDTLHLAGQRGYELPVTSLSRSDSSVERVARAGLPIFVPSVNPAPGVLSLGNEVATELSVPLLVAGELVGLMNVASLVADPIGKEDYSAIRLVGERLTVALELLRERRVATERLAKARQQLAAANEPTGREGLIDRETLAYRRPLLEPLLEAAIAAAGTVRDGTLGLLLVGWDASGPGVATRMAEGTQAAYATSPTIRYADATLAVLALATDEASVRATASELAATASAAGSEVWCGYAALAPDWSAGDLIIAAEADLANARRVESGTAIG